jgi:hypothetical protein
MEWARILAYITGTVARSMTSRPLPASRRNPLTVIDPSGSASAAATARRVSSSTSLRGGICRELRTLVYPDVRVPRR